jgi:hypothetical protein
VIRDELDAAQRVWRFDYSAGHDPRDHTALQADVRVIWNDLKQDPRVARVNRVNLTPLAIRSFWVWEGWRPVKISHLSTTFVYRRRDSGEWCEQHGFTDSPPEDDCRHFGDPVPEGAAQSEVKDEDAAERGVAPVEAPS